MYIRSHTTPRFPVLYLYTRSPRLPVLYMYTQRVVQLLDSQYCTCTQGVIQLLDSQYHTSSDTRQYLTRYQKVLGSIPSQIPDVFSFPLFLILSYLHIIITHCISLMQPTLHLIMGNCLIAKYSYWYYQGFILGGAFTPLAKILPPSFGHS